MIERTTPDVGYIAPEFFRNIGVSQGVKAGGLIHFSGIVAAGPNAEPLCVDDPPGQVRCVIGILGRLLAHEGLTFADLVSTTVFTPDIERVSACIPILGEAFRDHPPTSTWIGVQRLGRPEFLLELVAIAALRDGR